jgi:single-stranded-DNA-specific exonuclease
MKFVWSVAKRQPEMAGRLAAEMAISPLLAQCLLNRGLATPEAAAAFLDPRLKNLADPFLLPGMTAAVDRLLVARERSELLVIFGDYDVDGVTAAALLLQTLGELGWRVEHFLPDRLEEGYGLSRDGVDRCRQRFPVRLLLAVDCGSNAFEVISELRREGIEVIVLDHHQVSDPPPPAVALVNPQLGADFKELCAAGLAFKLAHALLKRMREMDAGAGAGMDLRAQLELVALGTVADLVPLRGENRILVTAGLQRLNATRHPGLLALQNVAGIKRPIGGYEVGFQLAPRLNAAGRLENAQGALRLLLTQDAAEAEALALALDGQNRQGGHRAAALLPVVEPPAHRPGGEGAGWRGSGRSIEGFDLAAALRNCAELLTRHGGHAMAAGLSMDAVNVALLRVRLNELARAVLRPEQLHPGLKLDAEVAASELTVECAEELGRLEPTGQGNPSVKLAVRGLCHQQPPQRMGKQNQHVKFRVGAAAGVLEAVWWNCGEAELPEGSFDIAGAPFVNEYHGRRSVQLKVLDWQPRGDAIPGPPPR